MGIKILRELRKKDCLIKALHSKMIKLNIKLHIKLPKCRNRKAYEVYKMAKKEVEKAAWGARFKEWEELHYML